MSNNIFITYAPEKIVCGVEDPRSDK